MGAWIETITAAVASMVSTVAPRVGAWIETLFAAKYALNVGGRPSRGGVD